MPDKAGPQGGAAESGRSRERGSAVADFTMVTALLTIVFMAVLQLALVLHVRNTLIDAASSGARYGALADRTPEDGVERARSLIVAGLGTDYSGDVEYREQGEGPGRMLRITVRAPMPIAGLLGPPDLLEVSGHAFWPARDDT